MKDIEILLRSFAMLIEGSQYKPSMTKFLNNFSKNSKAIDKDRINYLEKLFESFISNCQDLPTDAFLSKSQKFNISLFDSTFSAICGTAFSTREFVSKSINHDKLIQLQNDQEFIDASKSDTASKTNVEKRLLKAREYLLT